MTKTAVTSVFNRVWDLFERVSALKAPQHVTPVADFDASAYMGKWYEVARLDHSFERGMEQVTTEHSLRADGGIRMVNRGYMTSKGRWRETEAKAYPLATSSDGLMKVSFLGPLYLPYVVFDWDEKGEEYAFVTSDRKSCLWLLSRTPEATPAVKQKFLAHAEGLNISEDSIVWVKHTE